jgi:hypothetical protein
MRSKTLTCIAAAALFATLAISVRVIAQGEQHPSARFTATELGTLGGPTSFMPDEITLSTRPAVELSAMVATEAISGPNATLSPTSLTFSSQLVGTSSLPKTVTLRNNGTAHLTISSIGITGLNAGNFTQTHTCGTFLAVGASCTISVKFKPNATGTRTAAVSVHDNAANSPQKVALYGTGVAGRCTPYGQQCPSFAPPCCPGLVCTPASTRAFCF